MRKLLVAFAVGIATLVVPTASSAAPPDVIHGGCGFNTDENAIVTGGANVGVIYDVSATTDATGVPIDATVTCSIIINGVEAPGTKFSYSGFAVQGGVDRISFTADPGDWVAICQVVTFGDGTTQTDCPPWGDPNFPPQFVIDLLNNTFNLVNGVLESVDPYVCPVLESLAGSYGPVTITPTGDIYVADPLGLVGTVYDCPPYMVS